MIVATDVKTVLPWWEQKQNTLYTWALLCFFSAITLAVYENNDQKGFVFRSEVVIISCCSISLFLSALAPLAHLSPSNAISRRFVGTVFNGIITFSIRVYWGITNLLLSMMQVMDWGKCMLGVQGVSGPTIRAPSVMLPYTSHAGGHLFVLCSCSYFTWASEVRT